MRDDRAAKRTVRKRWVDEVKKYPEANGPVYLTLPGAEGKDIDLLIEEGVIQLTDTGAIAEADIRKVVAVESNSEAVLSLQRKFVGLRIHESPIQNIISGVGPYAWPNAEISRDLCAKVVNIDLDKALKAETNGSVRFPIIDVIQKISQLHSMRPDRSPPEPWSLCLTVNSSVNWPPEAVTYFFRFLGENCEHVGFERKAREILGDAMVHELKAHPDEMRFEHISINHRRALLCIFLPKLILSKINDHGWSATQCTAWSYGDGTDAAMTTVMLSFGLSQYETPAQRYQANLSKIFDELGHIDEDGTVTPLVA